MSATCMTLPGQHSALSRGVFTGYVPSVICVAKTVRYPGVGVLPTRVGVHIEVPRGSFVKRRRDGGVDFVSPLPCPFNYGSIPDLMAADGEPLDALVFGPSLPFGTSCEVEVRGVVDFLDDGVPDPKVVCSPAPLSPAQRRAVERFFRLYARLKAGAARVLGRPRGTTAFRGWLAAEAN